MNAPDPAVRTAGATGATRAAGTTAATPGGTLARRLLGSLNAVNLGVAIGLAITMAALYSPIFVTSFPALLGRTVALAMFLLLVFVGAQHWPERLPHWLPRWLFTLLAVALAAPLGTFLIYLASVGGDLRLFLTSEARLRGFFFIAIAGLLLGMFVTFTALVREREARARSLALELELERSRLERQTVDARLALLTAQIEPHFLFNTLANVQALVEGGSPRAAPVLQSLIAYLRAAIPRLHDGEPTLGREMALVRAYLELMAMRMPDRLRVSMKGDATLDAEPFPAMALLTLAENAVRHGADPSEQGADIEVGCRRNVATGALHVWVADTGPGMAEHAAPGTGLTNLRERLQGRYGERARLELAENSPHGLRAEIVVQPA